ncbi:aspartyl/asparaginyl beta-hydroxylase-like isoform X2 [Palaemon carinicauda]|uniref:aspartyl/asparaginyl beta-hydroxylase-like isoform X2 n=1 Tax=Palaemon carinicauda TaxID=392227 RepID=UPI0035B68353
MSGDLQTRKRRGKAKKKDEAEDDIFDAKTKPMVNNSHKVSNGGAGGGGGSSNGSSGLVAKIIFLILLVSLSIVIGLILIELRGKQAGMEMASVVPKAEEQAAPEIPTPSLHVEEPGPEAPSVSEPEIEDEFEPFEATPPLEEYVSVVEKEEEPVEEEVVEVVEDIPVEVVEEIVEEAAALPLEGIEIHEESEEPIPAESEEEAIPVEEEAEELAPVEEVVEAAVSEEVESPAAVEEVEEEATPEEVEEPAAAEEEEELEEPTVDLDVEELAAAEEVVQAVVEEPAVIEEVVEVPAIVEEVEEPAAVEELEEPAVVEEVEEPAVVEEVEEPAVVEEVEELAVVEEVEEPAVVEEVEEPAVVEEVEEPAVVEVEEPAVVEEVEEPAVVEVEESAPVVEAEEEVEVAPVEAVPVPPVEEEPVQVVEEPVIVEKVEEVEAPIEVEEKEDDDDDDDDDEEEEEEDPEDDEDKDDDEVDEPKIVLPPPEEEDDEDWSQYGKDGGIEDLTQAYLRVESLAEEVLRLDPENSMVNHIAPHLSGVLRAMEEGRTEGILDTLNHIQVILEDVKKRMEDSQDAPEPAAPEAQIDEAMPSVEAELEAASVEAELEAASEPIVEAPVETVESVEEAQHEPIVEASPEPVVEVISESVEEVESGSVVEAIPEPLVEVAAEVEALEPEAEVISISEAVEAGEPLVEAEVPIDISQGASESINEEHPIPVQEEKDVPEEVLANIEEQIIPHEEAAAVEEMDIPIPPITESDTDSSPEAEEKKEGEEPVPVEEVIPDPIHIQPLQGDGAPIDGTADAKSMYGKADITSDVDYDIREELDAAEKLISENLREALTTFGALLQNNPKSARALYGRAMCLDRLAEEERSNSKLEQAILTYRGVIDLADEEPSLVPLPLLRFAAEKCIDRMRFRGFFGKAVRVQQRLLQRFPDDLALRNQMGVTYLLMHQPSAAKEVFEAILEKWPEDGFAQVHYGFILKTNYQNYTGGAIYMKKGIESKAEGTQDGRFFLHLGDALQREGQVEEAYEVYEEAVEKGLFLNRYQRSLYNVDRLKSQPTWTVEQTTYTEFFRKLEANWQAIRDEAVALLAEPPQDGFRPESENLRSKGDWKQYEMYSRGRKITANCVKAKVTCSLIDEFTPAAGCKRGQVKFSVMDPGTHVYAHTGPTNCRLRAHLGLVIPSGVQMRVADQMVNWEEGKIFIFDDSWEHEVWHNGTTKRLVLIVDVWHPELTDHEKKSLSPL